MVTSREQNLYACEKTTASEPTHSHSLVTWASTRSGQQTHVPARKMVQMKMSPSDFLRSSFLDGLAELRGKVTGDKWPLWVIQNVALSAAAGRAQSL